MPTHALLRRPGPNFAAGLTTARLGAPDFAKALRQHEAYAEALQECELELIILEADERFPDGCFVEDTAVVTGTVAVRTRPGAPERRGETEAVAEVLAAYREVVSITAPGTVDGGDILRDGDHFFIGRSDRTNAAGARQLAAILAAHGYTSSEVPVRGVLHLKTAVTGLGPGAFICTDDFYPWFSSGRVIRLGAKDAYAANCLLLNDTLLMPAGFPTIRWQLAELGYPIIELEMSEFRKMDGGLTCLSVVW